MKPKPMPEEEVKLSHDIYAMLKGLHFTQTERIIQVVKARLRIDDTLSGDL